MNEIVQEMIDWIEEHLKGTFSLDALATHTGYSPYYCSFLFHLEVGMNLRKYVLLRKLYVSMEALTSNAKILDVALAYGYSSQEAYSRAFKKVFGCSPAVWKKQQKPIQSFAKKRLVLEGGTWHLNYAKEVAQLKKQNRLFDDAQVLNIFNGQMMYDQFHENQWMGQSDYIPFNEAMCVHETTMPIFSDAFIQLRAKGHRDSEKHYREMVVQPFQHRSYEKYAYIVLWFGEDLFCQMNVLTVLAFLEQQSFRGTVMLNSFREDEFKVNQMQVELGHYEAIYDCVLLQHRRPKHTVFPVMYQAIEQYMAMLEKENDVTYYIRQHPNLSEEELIPRLFQVFSTLGYGDLQYSELIRMVREKL